MLATAHTDSMRLADFHNLDEATRRSRTHDAEMLRKKAADTKNGPHRMEWLQQAAERDPSQPMAWIELADVLRLMGYRAEAAQALETTLYLVKQKSGQEKKQLAMEYYLARAWLNYEQAEWKEGLARADLAVKYGGGQRAHLIAALNRAGNEITDQKMRESLGVFYPLNTGTNRRRNWAWAYKMWRHQHHISYTPIDGPGYKSDSFKFPENEVLRWRDRGLVEEANNQGTLALQAYARSAEYHPFRDGQWMRRLEREVPGAKGGFPPAPFWVNRENDYVTGSLLAYEGYCHDRMKAETEPEVKAGWAGRVVWSGSAAANRYPYRPWTRLWRCEAYLVLDQFKEAEDDITHARAWFEEFEIVEPAMNPVEGHILLLEKNYRDALPILEQAAKDFPEDGKVWADLGLVRVKKLGRDPARSAFDRALELDPSQAVAWHNRGMLNLQDKLFAEALSDLEAAVALAPHDAQIRSDLTRVREILQYQDK